MSLSAEDEYKLGQSLKRDGKYSEALIHYYHVVNEFPEVWRGIGHCYYGKGEYKEAYNAYSKAVEHGCHWAHADLAEMYAKGNYVKKDIDKSVHHCQQIPPHSKKSCVNRIAHNVPFLKKREILKLRYALDDITADELNMLMLEILMDIQEELKELRSDLREVKEENPIPSALPGDGGDGGEEDGPIPPGGPEHGGSTTPSTGGGP